MLPLDILTAYLVGVGGGLTVALAEVTINGRIGRYCKRIREQPPEYEDYEPRKGRGLARSATDRRANCLRSWTWAR